MKTAAVQAMLLLLAALPLQAQTTAMAGAPAALAGFGGALAVSAGQVIVGEGNSQMRSGIVYVYRKGANGWAEATRLTAPGAANGDGFGASLSVDGSLMIVGATHQNEGMGAAYVFQRSADGAWTPAGQMSAADVSAGDRFGAAVALDGDVALVAAPAQGEGTGAVYVFRRSGNAWTQEAKLAARVPAQGEAFGAAVAVTGDRALIGVPERNDEAGVVLTFTRDAAGQWSETGQIAPGGLERNAGFGARILLDDDLAYIGAPGHASAGTVFAFRLNESGEWRPDSRFFPLAVAGQEADFGAGIAMDEQQLMIGAPDGGGSAFLYAPDAEGEWSRAERIVAEEVRGNLGVTVGIDGDLAAAGASSADFGAGAVVVFERVNGQWSATATLMSPDERLPSITGEMVRCGADGTAALWN
ncbi:MAG: hypothetical protein ACRELX_04150, partial [Longimicrobiales bacterium]